MKSGRRKPAAAPVQDHASILRVIRSIPRGCVACYGEIAERAGWPRRARLVGRILRESSDSAGLPWHRVLRSDGRLAFAAGSRTFREQVRRLSGEGVLVLGGRVDLQRHGWERNLDAVLWAPPPVKAARRERAGRGRRAKKTSR
jgi:methylated-DNA-protein-cysteine methyltransferase-like protein